MTAEGIYRWARYVEPYNYSEGAWRCAWAIAKSLGHAWARVMPEPADSEGAGAGAHVLDAWVTHLQRADPEWVGRGPEESMANISGRRRYRWRVEANGLGVVEIVRPVQGVWTPGGASDNVGDFVDVCMSVRLDGRNRRVWMSRPDGACEAFDRHFVAAGVLLQGLQVVGWEVDGAMSSAGLVEQARAAAARAVDG